MVNVVFIEGFEEAQQRLYLQRKWDQYFPNSAAFSAGAFVDTTALDISAGNTLLRTRSFGLDTDTFSVGIRMKLSSTEVSGNDSIRFLRGAGEQVRFDIIRGSTASFFKLRAKVGSTTLGTTADISCDAWHYVEVSAVVKTSATGSVDVFVDEHSALSVSGVVTADTGSTLMDVIYFTFDGGMTGSIDDIYVNKGTTLGDCKIKAILVDLEGTTNDWTPSTGSDNSDLVDDGVTSPNDADYVAAALDDKLDQYTVAALSGITTPIITLQLNVATALESAGSRHIEIGVDSIGTEALGGQQAVSSTVYSTVYSLFDTDPDTASAWTQTSINALLLEIYSRA
jgi:hypothetical protein